MRVLSQDFKKFIMRGNVLDLAVAVVVGAAFKTVVDSFANDVILAAVAAVFGKPSFNDLTFAIGDGVIRYGSFLTALVQFLIIAFAVFMVVKTFETLQRMRGTAAPEADELTTDQQLLTEIRDALRTRGQA